MCFLVGFSVIKFLRFIVVILVIYLLGLSILAGWYGLGVEEEVLFCKGMII